MERTDIVSVPYVDHGTVVVKNDIMGHASHRLERRSYRRACLTPDLRRELARQGWCYQASSTRRINGRRLAFDLYVRLVEAVIH